MGLQREHLISHLILRLIPRWFRRIFSLRVEKPLFPLDIKLSARDSAQLLEDIESPPSPNDELKKALSLYKEAFGTNP